MLWNVFFSLNTFVNEIQILDKLLVFTCKVMYYLGLLLTYMNFSSSTTEIYFCKRCVVRVIGGAESNVEYTEYWVISRVM